MDETPPRRAQFGVASENNVGNLNQYLANADSLQIYSNKVKKQRNKTPNRNQKQTLQQIITNSYESAIHMPKQRVRSSQKKKKKQSPMKTISVEQKKKLQAEQIFNEVDN